MRIVSLAAVVLGLSLLTLSGCQTQAEEPPHHEAHNVVVTTPVVQDVVITQEYVCQIHSRRHIDVCTLEDGYLRQIAVKEGQAVKQGDVLFEILPTLYQAKLDAELAEVRTAKVELEQSKKLAQDKVVSQVDVNLHDAKVAKAEAQAKLAEAELKFTEIRAPFDGIVDRLHEQLGSLIAEGDMLTTLSDNSVMWVYFNVPEARYLEYMATPGARDPEHPQQLKLPGARIEVRLADGSVFNQTAGDVVTVEANFDNETGNIAFRADFPNPDRILRHGQTGTVVIHRTLHNAVVIPQQATFEILDKQYVYVVEPPGAGAAADGAPSHAAEHGREPNAGEAAPQVAERTEQGGGHGEAQHLEHGTEQHGEAHADGPRGVVRQRHFVRAHEMDDVYVIDSGLGPDDQIVLEGVRQVHDGQEINYTLKKPENVLGHLKHHAE